MRLRAYLDTRGILTVGVGRNLDANPLSTDELQAVGHDARTRPITHDQALFLLHNDEAHAINALCANCSWWISLDDVRARAMVDLMFNMGWGTLQTFKHFLADMATKDYEAAGKELLSSKWYNQVGLRGPRIVDMISLGKDFTA
jgi:GH24 family phage-related lysozyme (muramidase)